MYWTLVSTHFDDDQNDPPSGSLREREEDRRKKREDARDQNRPNLNESSAESDTTVDNDEQWSDEEDEKPVKLRNLNDSLDYQRQIDEWQKGCRKTSHSSFTKNRRSSSSTVKSARQCTPRKGSIRNFISSNIGEVNRMSDIYVSPPRRSETTKAKVEENGVTWNEVRIFVLGISVAIMSVLFYAQFAHKKI